jgi:hypothetical protein
MDAGIQTSIATPISNPLPPSWLGRISAPPVAPIWANIGAVSATGIRNLLAQIGYDLSTWNYELIGSDNQLGRYQTSTAILEAYGLLVPGANADYGTACVTYKHCWQPTFYNNGVNAYQNYFYNIPNMQGFLQSSTPQEHLAYQRLVDIYYNSLNIGAIKDTDTMDMIAGMMYVGWVLGVGTSGSSMNATGTGAWAWRYFNIGNGANSYNSGRYAITVLGS